MYDFMTKTKWSLLGHDLEVTNSEIRGTWLTKRWANIVVIYTLNTHVKDIWLLCNFG